MYFTRGVSHWLSMRAVVFRIHVAQYWIHGGTVHSYNPELYGDLVYKFKKIIGKPNFSDLFKRIVNRFRREGYTLDNMRQTSCLVFNPIMVEGYAALLSYTAVVQAGSSVV